MTLLGRLRAALGRDEASLLARARSDLRFGLGLNPPACLPPLNRAIHALERLPVTAETGLMLGQALCAKARASSDESARNLRARAVATLKAQLDQRRVSRTDRAALWAALAQAWLPMPDDLADHDRSFRQLLRAEDAQRNALDLPDAATHLAMADILLAMCQHPLCPAPRDTARAAQDHVRLSRSYPADSGQRQDADAVEAAVRHLFPGLAAGETR